MTSNPRFPPSLPKWPFVTGDLILVALALLVLLRSGAAMNAWQILFCVLAVVVGALLLLAPFVVEFYLKQKLHEAESSRTVDSILARLAESLQEMEAGHQRQRDTSRRIETTLSAYEGIARRVDEKVQSLGVDEQAITRSLQSCEEEWGRRLDAMDSTLRKRLDRLEAALKDLRRAEASPPAAAGPGEMQAEAGVDAQQELIPSEHRMLVKAMGSGGGKPRSPAVRRIIEGPARKAKDGTPPELVASILIGIGNRLFVRGEGPGLSWEKGVAMEFVEIGKYRWRAPEHDQEVTCRIYLNDTLPQKEEAIRIQPGEALEVTPDFSNS